MNDAMIGVANQVYYMLVTFILGRKLSWTFKVLVFHTHLGMWNVVQVQQLLQKMQLPVVMDAIEALIQARPYSARSATPTSSSATPTSGSPHGSSPNLLVASEGGGRRDDEEAETRKTLSLNRSARSAKWNSRQLSVRRSELCLKTSSTAEQPPE